MDKTEIKLRRTEEKFDVALGWMGVMFALSIVFLIAINSDLFYFLILGGGTVYVIYAYLRYRSIKNVGDEIERELRDGNLDN